VRGVSSFVFGRDQSRRTKAAGDGEGAYTLDGRGILERSFSIAGIQKVS